MNVTSITHTQPAVHDHSCRNTEALKCTHGTSNLLWPLNLALHYFTMRTYTAFRLSRLSNLDFLQPED